MSGNGQEHHACLRVLLVLFSLFGTVAQNAASGVPLDPSTIAGDVTFLVTMSLNVLISHSFYRAIFARQIKIG
jgi:hypothetical protein